jgi:hypothetical protein
MMPEYSIKIGPASGSNAHDKIELISNQEEL